MNETRSLSPPTISPEQGPTTTPGSAGRVPTSSPRLTACGDVEEASAALDAAISTRSMPSHVDALLRKIQDDLSDLRADLSMPHGTETLETVRIAPGAIAHLEAIHNEYQAQNHAPENTMPSNASPSAGLLRLACTITRRAERSVWTLVADDLEATSRCPAVYLDRLGDLLCDIATYLDRKGRDDIPVGFCYEPEPLYVWDR